MSGGTAYVLDLDANRTNTELVDLGPVPAEESEFLKGLVTQHLEETGSDVAEALLADWDATLARFTEVMPRDYRIVMEAKAKAEADGLDEAEVAKKMMESLHG